MIGERVRLAREASRLTQQELATAAGVSQGTLSDVESGRVLNPADEIIERVAEATQFPRRFFYLGALPDFPEGHYRRLARGTSKVGKQVRAQVRQVLEIVQRSEAQLMLPSVRLEPVDDLSSMEMLEAMANEVRDALGLGRDDPIPNVMRAIERAGVVVVRLPGEMEDHDGYSAWPDAGFGGRPIIALMGGHPGDRDRFNAAHEVGHLVLHTRRGWLDRKQAEAEASRFAGALLLPKRPGQEALKRPVTLRVLMGVKANWGLSIAAAAQRALDLNVISRPHFVSLRKQLSARRWTREEPVEVRQERPVLISKVVEALAGQGSTTERADRLAMPVFAFRALTAA